jgi:alkylation response protein AidB-like acyl-CoA dehydrogenase
MTELDWLTGPLSDVGQTVERYVDRKIRPVVEELDATGRFPAEIYDELASMGLLGLTAPVELGGGGGGYQDFAEVMELLSYGYASVADQVGLVEILAHLLARHGTQKQQSDYLGPLVSAKLRGAYAITEPGAGSDAGSVSTRAVRCADGWRVSGEKIYIHNAPVADFAVALVVTDPDRGKRGLSTLIIPLDLPGVSIVNKAEKLGQRASPLSGIHLDDVLVPADALLGEEGRGFHNVMAALDVGRLGIAALSLGISRAALLSSVVQARQRVQFGRRIGDNQGVLFPLADLATEYRAGKALLQQAAALLDAGKPATVACSMAKLYTSEACVRHASAALQVYGGSGFIRGFEVERLYRDCRITQIYEGTSEIQRTVIGRQLLGPDTVRTPRPKGEQ